MERLPFAVGSGRAFTDNTPFLGGWIRVLSVAAGATVDIAFNHGLRVVPRVVIVLYAGTAFTARTKVGATAWTASSVTIQFDTAQPIGTVLWIW